MCNGPAQVEAHALVDGVVVPHASVFRSVIECIQKKEKVEQTKDPRKHRMALRYSACSEETLEESHGFVGVFDQAEHQDLTAVGCRDATVGILEELCTKADGYLHQVLRTLAALADAHDEAFLVTRVADADGLEPSDLLRAMQQ
eukprot:s854_g2.t1